MPPKRAKKGAISQTEKAIADTQAAVEEATQHAVREQDTQSDAVDAETQVDADPQSDAGVTSSEHVDSSNANVADGAMVSTADDADDADDDAGAATPATEVTTDDEADAEPDAQPKVAHKKGAIAGKKMPATTTKNEDGSEKKIRKKKRKNDPTNFHAYIHEVQKEMYPTLSMSKTAMCIMNDFTNGKHLYPYCRDSFQSVQEAEESYAPGSRHPVRVSNIAPFPPFILCLAASFLSSPCHFIGSTVIHVLLD
ncbi:histone-fold-containing protein [Aureobasidium pullulans]|nr:histone-fold-containing protein [Aureobasidium pullulans]